MTQSTNNPEAPRSIQGRVSIQQVGSETLVYDESRHQAFCLNRSSSVIWRLANGERTVAEIGKAASLELETSASEEFVRFALEQLHRDGLVEWSRSAEGMPSISRRTLLRRLGVGGALLLPAVAAIIAPTAAQAYSGCVDCSAAQSARAQQLARAKRQGGAAASGSFNNSNPAPYSPYTTTPSGQPANKPSNQ